MLSSRELLAASRNVSAGEKLATFLFIVGQAASNRHAQERFQRSGWTISKFVDVIWILGNDWKYRSFHESLNAIAAVAKEVIQLPDPNNIPPEIQNNPKMMPFFKDCIGALDGTHIPCQPPKKDAKPYRNRKGFLSQNVLAVCSFDLRFLYVLPGWEGSAADGSVLSDAMFDKGLIIPKGKYFLGDAGYPLKPFCLTPYRGIRYHLREWSQGNQSPQNAKELYNLRHAQQRNAIERIFGVLTKRFPILNVPPEYRIQTQVYS